MRRFAGLYVAGLFVAVAAVAVDGAIPALVTDAATLEGHAFGNDARRPGCPAAGTVLVEREWRQRLDGGVDIRSDARRKADAAREHLLVGPRPWIASAEERQSIARDQDMAVQDMAWALAPASPRAGASSGRIHTDASKGPSAAPAALSAPASEPPAERFTPSDRRQVPALSFEGLPKTLQESLRVQLKNRGDVSTVIEMPGGFVVYALRAKTEDTLSVTVFSIPKQPREDWIAKRTPSVGAR